MEIAANLTPEEAADPTLYTWIGLWDHPMPCLQCGGFHQEVHHQWGHLGDSGPVCKAIAYTLTHREALDYARMQGIRIGRIPPESMPTIAAQLFLLPREVSSQILQEWRETQRLAVLGFPSVVLYEPEARGIVRPPVLAN